MEITYLSVACFCFSIQFVFHKLFQKYSDSSFASGIWCSLINALAMLVFLLPKVGFSLEISKSALICAAVYAFSTLVYTVMTMVALKRGKLSAVTTFTLLGGLILPFAWGIFVYHEEFTKFKAIGLLLLILCMTAGMLPDRKKEANGKAQGQKQSPVFIVSCLLLFLANGALTIAGVASQKAADAVSSDSFLMLYLIETAVLSLLILFGCALVRQGRGEHGFRNVFYEFAAQPPMRGKIYLLLILFCALHSICNGVGNLASLNCARTMDSSVQFPIISAVVIVLGAVFGLIFFREKINKRDAAGLLLACGGIVCFSL